MKRLVTLLFLTLPCLAQAQWSGIAPNQLVAGQDVKHAIDSSFIYQAAPYPNTNRIIRVDSSFIWFAIDSRNSYISTKAPFEMVAKRDLTAITATCGTATPYDSACLLCSSAYPSYFNLGQQSGITSFAADTFQYSGLPATGYFIGIYGYDTMFNTNPIYGDTSFNFNFYYDPNIGPDIKIYPMNVTAGHNTTGYYYRPSCPTPVTFSYSVDASAASGGGEADVRDVNSSTTYNEYYVYYNPATTYGPYTVNVNRGNKYVYVHESISSGVSYHATVYKGGSPIYSTSGTGTFSWTTPNFTVSSGTTLSVTITNP